MKPPLDAARVPCRVDPDAWAAHEVGDRAQTVMAKHICRTRCPLVEACAEFGIRHERYGIWGGLGPEERRRIRTRRGIILETPTTGIERHRAAAS